MAHETVTKSKRFYCVSLIPDICKTPVGSSVVPIPYTITGEFADAQSVSNSVKTHGEPVFLHGRSFIPAVKGDERGTLGGIKSGTNLKKVETNGHSSTKGANGTQTVQESRLVWMNNRNTIGRIYEHGVQNARSRLKSLFDFELRDAARYYKDNVSAGMHEFGQDAMDTGGDILTASAATGLTGAAVGATGVGLPVAAAMETAAAAGGTVGGVVTGTGYAADTTATVLDHAADYILTGKVPDTVAVAKEMALDAAVNVGLSRVPWLGGYIKKWHRSHKAVPGKTPPPAKPPAKAGGGNGKDGHDGGKTKQEKKPKGDKPSDCCPKDGAPGGKPVRSAHPVHFGTGEEILAQTDFVLDGPTPLEWVRTYRSGSETEDWGLLGARWATPYTSSLLACAKGTVYVDASGRALRLPALAAGQQHDHRAEGFILRRDGDSQFTITWRDGSTDTFVAGPDGWLPHGYDGVNAMLAPGEPVRARRFYLARRAERDGSGITIERHHDARPGEVLLRVRTDDGLVIEALRDPYLAAEAEGAAPRIGRIEQVLPDGSRVCHVRYRYEADEAPADTLPLRCGLAEQANIDGRARTYAYRHHLLVRYTTYGGFAHGLEWVSLAALRERWAGVSLDDARLAARNPITAHNSYQARAVRTTTADGRNEVAIAYVDPDTTRVTEPDGGVLEYRFDANWLATDVRRIGPDGSVRPLGRREWDRDGMLLADLDADGAATRYAYDAAGNLVAVTDAQGHVTGIDYGPDNLPVTVTDALGHATHSRYDEAGRLVERIDALGRRTGYGYDGQGRLVTVTDARGGVKRLAYDDAGRLASYTDCSGYTSRYHYDAAHRLAEQVDAVGNATRYQYDTLGRVSAVVHPDGATERFEYDADGNLLAHVDAKGYRTRYRYDGHGLLVERIDAKEQRLCYRYDRALRLTELINGNGESYRLAYDPEGRVNRETGFDGKITTYVYSNSGVLKSSECGGLRIDFARDELGYLIAKSTPDGAVRYAYDAMGRITASVSDQADQRFIYDPVGQLVEERSAYLHGIHRPGQTDGQIATFTMTHAYDELGNRIQTILPNGRRVDTLRYGSGHWHGTLWQGKTLIDLERDHLHREKVRELGGARERLIERRSYDPQSRLKSFALDRGNVRLRERHYGYDLTGNLTEIDDAVRGRTYYSYDPLGQLLAAVQSGLHETFAFDPAGNLFDPDSTDSPIDTRKVLRELDDRPMHKPLPSKLPKVTRNLLLRYMGYEYEHDVQGNIIRKRPRVTAGENDEGNLILEYDADNRLTTAIRAFDTSRVIARYSYDAFGRRIAKRVAEQCWQDGEPPPPVSNARCGSPTLFVWDGDVMVQEISADKTVTYLYEPESFLPLVRIDSREDISDYSVIHSDWCCDDLWKSPQGPKEFDAHIKAWETYLSNHREQQRRYCWQKRIAQAETSATTDRILYFQCDHIGTPLELVDENGTVAWAAQYRAWGRLLQIHRAEVDQPLRFQGQYHDKETDLYYNRHRYYDPDAARYVSQDPIGLLGGYNPYSYGPNPVEWVDPLGLARKKKNSQILGEAATGCKTWPNKQAHHLIPEEHVDHYVLKNIEFRMNSGSNAIMLPKKQNAFMTHHNGYHSAYNSAVEKELDYIGGKYANRTDRLHAVRDLQRNLDHALRLKKLPLYMTECGKKTGLKAGDWERYIRSSRRY